MKRIADVAYRSGEEKQLNFVVKKDQIIIIDNAKDENNTAKNRTFRVYSRFKCSNPIDASVLMMYATEVFTK